LGAYREIVLLDEDVPGTSMPKVFADNVAGGRLATEHLIRQGHRRIAHVSGPAAVMSVRERREGYELALAAAGIPLRPDYLLLGEYSRDFGRQAAATLLDLPEPPQAIFAASDFIAVGVLDTLRERGLAVPAALSLVGFDDAPYAELLTPPLSTVRQSARDLGRQGIEALLAVLAGQPVVREQRVAVTLVERGSVAPVPAPR
jgi:LacI family transcriptional regulator